MCYRGVGMVNYGILTDNFTLILLNGLLLMLNGYYILTYVILVEHKVDWCRFHPSVSGPFEDYL